MSRQRPDRPPQLWLDVARPVQPVARRRGQAPVRGAKGMTELTAPIQMELRIAGPPQSAAIAAPAAASTPASAIRPSPRQPTSFCAWLLDQVGRYGTLGELANAARLDPLFPRNGSADDVRARFSAAGAEGDAFAALGDAEREYDR